MKTILDKDIRNLVIARLRALSGGRKISVGSDGEFSKDELIKRVARNDNIGKKIIEIQLQYLRSLKDGLLLTD